ncbi:MAG: hypothetical protein AUJ04_06765 [Acidobacteria bacterium 13_1_40CM_3_55_6]|nr:MAG: hypothetical protein AUJ04_06765 [Acidobacteria bacterium 13_1_40CM_3_55_6]
MNTLKMLLLPLICLLSTATFAQDRTQVVCKGSPVPEGYAISGETISDSCNGTAWIIKPKAGPRSTLDRFNSAASNPVSLVERNEVIAPGQCDAFRQTVASTYNFNPERMSEEQIKAQSARLDVFWNQVRQSRGLLVPCLRKALEQETSGSFFNIDGSMLLVDIDPSAASRALQVRKFIGADLDGTDLEYWVKTMARRGVEGFDTSEAGAKWLSYSKAKYNLALHGGFPVDSFIGAVFIFGSMDEDLATPVLLRIVNQVGHPHRDDALAILMSQATPASLRALKQVNAAGFPAGTSQSIRELLENPNLLKPRAHPKLTREEQLIAFQGIIDGDYSAFREMVMKAPDGEVDAIAALRPEDIPLVRRTRRASISRCNQHALSDYASFTKILWALTWKPELVKR